MLVWGKRAGRTLRLLESLNIQVRTERLYEQLHSIETDFNHHQQLQTHAPFDAILKQEKDLDNEKNEAGGLLSRFIHTQIHMLPASVGSLSHNARPRVWLTGRSCRVREGRSCQRHLYACTVLTDHNRQAG